MKQTLMFCILALLCVSGAFVSESSAVEFGKGTQAGSTVTPEARMPFYNGYNGGYGHDGGYGYENRAGLSRAEIRAMPLRDRPNRPGHFIGNTIRRRSGR